jgi:hypothetical protein
MLGLGSPRWSELHDVYGAAIAIPRYLEATTTDTRPGHVEGSAWFALWSALCHQDDIAEASYAALPHLIARAATLPSRDRVEPLHLAAAIESVRLDGRGPEMPDDLAAAFSEALVAGRRLAEASVPEAWDATSRRVFAGSVAAFSGDLAGALAELDPEDE